MVADRQLAAQPVDQRAQQPDAVHRLERQHLARRRGSDVGVAVAVATDPGAEAERAHVGGQVDPERHEPVAQLLEDVGQGTGRQPLEVVDDVAGLVGRLGLLEPDLVGEPQQLHRLLEPARPTRVVGLLQQGGDATQLVDRRAPGDLGRVGGEDGTHGDLLEQRRDLVGTDPGLLDAGDRPLEPAALLGAGAGQGAAAVDLLGDVREVEVRRERAHQPGDRRQVEVGQLVEPALLGVRPDLLDQGEQVVALGARQRLAEDRRHATDVAAQVPVGGAVRRTPAVGLHAPIVTDPGYLRVSAPTGRCGRSTT